MFVRFVIQCGSVKTRSIFSKILTIATQNSPVRTKYGVPSVSPVMFYFLLFFYCWILYHIERIKTTYMEKGSTVVLEETTHYLRYESKFTHQLSFKTSFRNVDYGSDVYCLIDNKSSSVHETLWHRINDRPSFESQRVDRPNVNCPLWKTWSWVGFDTNVLYFWCKTRRRNSTTCDSLVSIMHILVVNLSMEPIPPAINDSWLIEAK